MTVIPFLSIIFCLTLPSNLYSYPTHNHRLFVSIARWYHNSVKFGSQRTIFHSSGNLDEISYDYSGRKAGDSEDEEYFSDYDDEEEEDEENDNDEEVEDEGHESTGFNIDDYERYYQDIDANNQTTNIFGSLNRRYQPYIGLESFIHTYGERNTLSKLEYLAVFKLFPRLRDAALNDIWPEDRDISSLEKANIVWAANRSKHPTDPNSILSQLISVNLHKFKATIHNETSLSTRLQSFNSLLGLCLTREFEDLPHKQTARYWQVAANAIEFTKVPFKRHIILPTISSDSNHTVDKENVTIAVLNLNSLYKDACERLLDINSSTPVDHQLQDYKLNSEMKDLMIYLLLTGLDIITHLNQQKLQFIIIEAVSDASKLKRPLMELITPSLTSMKVLLNQYCSTTAYFEYHDMLDVPFDFIKFNENKVKSIKRVKYTINDSIEDVIKKVDGTLFLLRRRKQ